MPLFGRKETPEEERARRAHEDIDAADAAAQAALEQSRQARAHALAVAEDEIRSAQTHVEETIRREQARLAAVTAEAREEADRAIQKAEEKAAARVAEAERTAQEAIDRAHETAAARHEAAATRAADLRGHAGVPGVDVHHDPHPTSAGWYADPRGEAAFRWWDGAAWTERMGDAG